MIFGVQAMRIQNIGKIIVALILIVPSAVSAQVVISEIMYDAPGTEGSGEHDWVEVFNSGASAVDINAYRFFEANTNHTLKLDRGSATLPSGGYAVIASATSTFLADWPAFSGTLFDSSFNLNSAGELIGIRVDSSDTTHDFSYSPADAATNNGSSLQRTNISTVAFSASAPTPGTGTLVSSNSSGTNPSSNSEVAVTTPPATNTSGPVSSASNFPIEPQIFAYAGKDREAIAGADSVFEARAFNRNKEQIKPGRFLWTFGDGASSEGQTVMHHFPQPGRYAVVLDIADGVYSASHQIIVTVLPVSISLTLLNDDIVLSNKSSKNLDLSYWSLRSGGKFFLIPKNTILLGGASVPFTKEVTHIDASSDAALLYPNGLVAGSLGAISLAPYSAPYSGSSASSAKINNVAQPASDLSPDSADVPDATSTAQSLVANAETAGNPGSSYLWWFGALGLALMGSAAVVFSRQARKKEWDIVEESAE